MPGDLRAVAANPAPLGPFPETPRRILLRTLPLPGSAGRQPRTVREHFPPGDLHGEARHDLLRPLRLRSEGLRAHRWANPGVYAAAAVEGQDGGRPPQEGGESAGEGETGGAGGAVETQQGGGTRGSQEPTETAGVVAADPPETAVVAGGAAATEQVRAGEPPLAVPRQAGQEVGARAAAVADRATSLLGAGRPALPHQTHPQVHQRGGGLRRRNRDLHPQHRPPQDALRGDLPPTRNHRPEYF